MIGMLTTARRWVFLLPALALISLQEAPAADKAPAFIVESSSTECNAVRCISTTRYKDVQGYAQRPDDQTLKSITVQWQKPELDTLGNLCTLRGQLFVPGKGQDPKQAVNWFQGIAVYLGMKPAAAANWSKGPNYEETLEESTVVSPAGEFRVRFDLRGTQRDPHLDQAFQIGIALASHTDIEPKGQQVDWSSQSPALPATIEQFMVPATRNVPRELELINRANGWPFSNPNSVDLIRAVNALQRLGKDKALATLEKYIELTSGDEYYFVDHYIVFWIIRVLFEPIRLEDRIPPPGIAVFLVESKSKQIANWPLNPMAIVDDVPFMVGCQLVGSSGIPDQPASHITWARRHGILRDQPLVPTNNPWATAEALIASRRFQALNKFPREHSTSSIRYQALAMLKGMVEPIEARGAGNDPAEEDRRWKERLKEAAGLGIVWDVKREEFVIKGIAPCP